MMEDTLDDESELIKDPDTIKEVSEKIFSVLQTKDESHILSEFYKNEYKKIDLTLCINSFNNDNTILTTLSHFNLTRATISFISLLSHIIKSSSKFSNYINQKNKKGYNALLYSAFRGNLEIFNKLMESGADISIVNSSGLNVLHLASQGNYPNMIVYLIEKYGLDINSKDNKGNTALHWAVYMNSKQAVDFLMYYNIDTNIRDNDGETALEIAVNKGNQYLIKRFNEDFSVLINKKLEESKENHDIENDNDIENNNNQNIELNNNTSNKKTKNNLNEFINKFWGTNSKNMAAFPFLLIIFILEGINQIIIIRGYNNSFMSFVFFILFFLLLFFYYITSKSDPGELTNKYINSLSLLAEQGEDLKNICPWCVNSINKDTHHCFLCNKCINHQEFHDVYLNNCIGRNNFSLYMNFLYYFTIDSLFKFIISFWGIFWLKEERFSKAIKLIIPQLLAVGACIVFCILKIKAKIQKYNNGFLNFENLLMKNKKDNLNDSSTAINNKKNMNIQLTSIENSEII